ncbi:hypothetical protein TNCV_753921 [Trichonephila clavipes]|nr:hypothetical protein TNCV_753921 [Trichonephila clavipes]
MPNIIDSHDMGLRTVLQSRRPKEADVIKSIKMGRLRFAGHICRMDPSSLMFRIFNYKPTGIKTRGRPKLR